MNATLKGQSKILIFHIIHLIAIVTQVLKFQNSANCQFLLFEILVDCL